jgi:hypothetical protein
MMSLARYGSALVLAAGLASPSRAETWPTLDEYVESCALIVKCRTEVGKGYRVVETWKGTYSPDLFAHRPPDGFVLTNNWHRNGEVADGREVMFFFTYSDHSTKLGAHSTAFHVKNGRVVYASTSWGMQQEFTVEEFRRAIRSIVRRHALAVRTAMPVLVGGPAAAGPLPEVPEEEPVAPASSPVAAEPGPDSPNQPADQSSAWHWAGAGGALVGLLLVIALVLYGRRGRAEPGRCT